MITAMKRKNLFMEIDLIDFKEMFEDDLDSWFTADIKCCDECYQDFVNQWPNVRLRAGCYPIETDFFYEGAKRLRHFYSKEEYLEGIGQLSCPRCGASLRDNYIYPYEFEFDPPEDFEDKAYELKSIIEETPFIVLKFNLASETFSLIEDFFSKSQSTKITNVLYRGRKIEGRRPIKKDFLAPPKDKTSDGRYNHLGIPVIYAANSAITCYNELRKPKVQIWISEFLITKKLKLLDLTDIDDYTTKGNLLQAIVWSSLATAKTKSNDWHKPEYYFTRFISDSCKYLGFDGIKYPSVQIGDGFNYVFFDVSLLKESDIDRIYKYENKVK